MRDVRVDAERPSLDLEDGRTIVVPISWLPRLARATPEHATWRVCGGYGIHGPNVDEDLSTPGLLREARPPAK